MSRPLALDDLYAMPLPSDPQLAPDASRVAYVVARADREADEDRSSIWLLPAGGGEEVQLTRGPHDTCPRWSPDGRYLAFLARRGDGQAAQVWLLPAGGGEAWRLTDLPLGAGEPVWSPDGSALAFVAVVDDEDGGTSDPERREVEPVVADRLDYKSDGTGLLRGRRRHLLVAALDGEVRQLTAGDFSVSSPVWSPDGARLAFTSSMREDRDLEPGSEVYAVSLRGGEPCRLTPQGGEFEVADWAPDGRSLLLVGQARPAVGHARLFSVPAGGGTPTALTPGYDRNVMVGATAYPGAVPRYAAGGGRVLFCARDRGRVHLLAVPAGGGDPVLVAGGDRVVGGMSTAGSAVAYVAATSASPGEVYVADLDGGGEQRLTSLFADALPEVRLVEPQERTFRAADGSDLHGWVLRGAAAGPTPLLLDVHGGPHNAWSPTFNGVHLYHQTLCAAGWTIVCCNPRGSDGYGERFWRGLEGRWGERDEADFLAVVDGLVAEGIADPARLAVTGYSYGGHMSCWLTARSDRFAAAVAGGSSNDLAGELRTSDISAPAARLEFGGLPQEQGDRYAALSPITYAAAVGTPTLLLHGERDDRCPVWQAEQWFFALRTRRVPVRMVRYPGATHGFVFNGRPSHRLDYCRRLQEWVTCHTATPSQATGDKARL